jgi:hypothetical protein
VVAAPGVVGEDVVERDILQVTNQRLGLGHYFLAAGENVNGFVFGEQANELSELGGDGFEMVGPGVGVTRPGEPDAGLGFPLGGPTVTEDGGGLVSSDGHESERNAEF